MIRTIAMQRSKDSLVPTNKDGRETIALLREHDRVLVKIHRPRNVAHHNLFWALLTAVGDGIGQSPEAVLTWLKYRMGRVDFVAMPDGMVVPSPQSISFASMDQAGFKSFYDEATRLILEALYPKISDDEKRLKVEELVAA